MLHAMSVLEVMDTAGNWDQTGAAFRSIGFSGKKKGLNFDDVNASYMS